MQPVDKNNFEQEVLGSRQPVLVDFWSPNCEKCIKLMPALQELEQRYHDKIKFVKVDVSKNRRLAIAQKVRNLPAIHLYRNGERVDAVNDQVTGEAVESTIKQVLH
ncbi:MAG TPA: thioredoxin fold domain-containing protein [Firmicutes bacterium]|jgi:thioredoxin 1|nr:thioredoxin fold domain-containing protein [Bacillota bacterium]